MCVSAVERAWKTNGEIVVYNNIRAKRQLLFF